MADKTFLLFGINKEIIRKIALGKIAITNSVFASLLHIEVFRTILSGIHIPLSLANKLRKSSKKKSSYASNKIEGTPLSYEQAEEAIDAHRHLLNPEQEIKNYFLALNLIEEKLTKKEPFSLKLILEIRKMTFLPGM
jgi:Fic family protein